VTLSRLPRQQAVAMTNHMAHDRALPAEVVEQVVAKTDGVPLFVEELTKMVLESGLLQEREDRYELTGPLPPLAIPTTLHDSLMARLDRLATVKGLAQLGATLGREFSYELLQAVSLWDEGALQSGLHRLVEAEFLYQRGLPPQATYLFKHALIQDVAYQSLLKSTRQQYHQHIAQVLEARFPELCETQPELLAHHYTEAGLVEQALPYWQRAGERAGQRSANVEAIRYLTRGLEGLQTLPDTPERSQHKLALHIALGPPLMATKGFTDPEVERVYTRARALYRQVGESPQLFPVLDGLHSFYYIRGEYRTVLELAQEFLTLAQRVQDPARLMGAHIKLGGALKELGELAAARAHLEAGLALCDPQRDRSQDFLYRHDGEVTNLRSLARILWLLGYSDQALSFIHTALTRAQKLAHPFILGEALYHAASLHQLRREVSQTQERAEAAMVLARDWGFPSWLLYSTIVYGWALSAQGQHAKALAQISQALTALQATGQRQALPYLLALLAEAYGRGGDNAAGLRMLAEALAVVDDTEEGWWEAELYRLKGELLLQHATGSSDEAEICFHQALDVARRQQARALELRAALSLSRLWQQQGKRTAAYELLAPIYGWFTEGFDSADLQEAKTVLAELGG
jgi:predicted ATPase